MATKAKTRKPVAAEESFEKPRSLSDGVKNETKKISKDTLDSFWKQLLKGSITDAVPQQVLGTAESGKDKKFSGELAMGQEVSLKKKAQNTIEEPADVKADLIDLRNEFHREYYRENVQNVEVKAQHKENAEIKQQVEEIRMEIKKLIKSSKQMEAVFRSVDATVDSPIEKPGQYHLNFFDWVLITLRNARARLEEGVSWGKTLSNKRAEKQYWSMAKKHGTTFSLSQERSTATQTG